MIIKSHAALIDLLTASSVYRRASATGRNKGNRSGLNSIQSERVGEWGFSVDLQNKQYPLVNAERMLRYKGFECRMYVVCF